MGGYSATSDLDLGKNFGNLDFWGGYSATSDLDLGEKLWKFEFLGLRGVFCNFGSGLGGKSWKFGILGWGGILQLRFWT